MNVASEQMLDYLGHLEALGVELEGAMAAISANALSRFEESVTSQQAICGRLNSFAQQHSASKRPALDPGDPLSLRLRQTAESLQTLNKCYATLLKHSSESVRQMAGLCRSYTGEFATQHQGWSCEL